MSEPATVGNGDAGQTLAPVSLLDALAGRFRSRAAMCRELEQIAVEETRWHDAATMKSHRMIWERAACMVEEERI